jgi:hypothetical protein
MSPKLSALLALLLLGAQSALAADLDVLERELDRLALPSAGAGASSLLPADERRARIQAQASAVRTAVEANRRVIVVNVPAYTLTAYEDGKPVLHSKVIVGAVGRKTPQLDTQVAGIQLNPAWTAPPKVVRGDLTKKGAIDERAVLKKGLTVYDEKGNPLPPEVLSFVPPEQQGRLRYYQPPGENNALGQVKITLKGVPDIYLHDTPNRALFGKKKRAMSSGCVRVESARELAAWLTGKSADDIDRMIATGKTRTLAAESTKVIVGYWLSDTADQRVVYLDDVYRLGQRRTPAPAEPAPSLFAAAPSAAAAPPEQTPVAAPATVADHPPPAVDPAAAPTAAPAPLAQPAAEPAPQTWAPRRAVITPANAPPWFGGYVRSALAGLELPELSAAVGAHLARTGAPPTMMLAIDRNGYVRAADFDRAAPEVRAAVQRHFERHPRTLPLPAALGADLDVVVVPVILAAARAY